jgi:hypothetical protein
MTVTSDWEPGSTITMRPESELGPGTTGRFRDVAICPDVLAVDPPHRHSYTLGRIPIGPNVYVTWELRPRERLTIVRLYLDEPDGHPGSEDDLNIIWLPILSASAENLNDPPATGQAA